MKFKKFLLTSSSIISLSSLMLASCTNENPGAPDKPKPPINANPDPTKPNDPEPGNSDGKNKTSQINEINQNKEIVIAIDGSLRPFYNHVIDAYNKTEIGKNYKVKTVSKDLWGALQLAFDSSDQDKDSLDIVYMPSDYITLLTQAKKLTFLDEYMPELFNEITSQIKASPTEKNIMQQFGSVNLKLNNNNTSKLLGIVHNTEGLTLASNLPENEAKEILMDSSTDTLVELIKEGKMLVRFQDFWYSNGVFAGVFEKIKQDNPELSDINLMTKILYTNPETNKVSSGFINTDKYNVYFKDAIKVFTSLFFPIYEAAYIKTEQEFQETPWAAKGITQTDLKATLSNNASVANDRIFSLLKNNKINFTVIGSWDAKLSQSQANAQSFFSVVKTDEDHEFIQAPGAWSFGISSKNKDASPERKDALKQFIKTIFDVSSYYELFKNGTNIPFVKEVYQDLKRAIKKENLEEYNKLTDLAKSQGYQTYEELKEFYFQKQEQTSELSILYEQATWGESWSLDLDKTSPSSEQNMVLVSSLKDELIKKEPNLTDQQFTEMKLQNILPLRNTVASLLGIENIDNLKGKKFPEWSDEHTDNWLVGKDLLKEGVKESQMRYEENGRYSEESLHMRKIEEYIFGVYGDNEAQKLDFIDKLTKLLWEDYKNNSSKVEELKTSIINKAQSFVNEFSKKELTLEEITKIVQGYLAVYLNPALVRFFYVKDFTSFPNTIYNEAQIAELKNWTNYNTWGESWSKNTNTTKANAQENFVSAQELKDQVKKLNSLQERDYETLEIESILPLRNTIASLLGLENVNLLVGKEENQDKEWLVSQDLLKEDSISHPFSSLLRYNTEALHMRKIEEFIFSVNGDNRASKNALLQNLTEALIKDIKARNSNNIDEIKTYAYSRAQLFVETYSKIAVDQTIIKQAIDGYLNAYLNPAKIRALVLNIIRRQSKNQSNVSVSDEVLETILAFEDKFKTNKTMNVFGSTTSIADGGLGITRLQPIRPDNSNPLFEQVWNIMNKEVFGNRAIYENMARYNIKTQGAFNSELGRELLIAFNKYITTLNEENKNTNLVIDN